MNAKFRDAEMTELTYNQLVQDLLAVLQGRMSKWYFMRKWNSKLKKPYKTICNFEQRVHDTEAE